MNEPVGRALARLEVLRARALDDPSAMHDLENFVGWSRRTFGGDSDVALEAEFILLANEAFREDSRKVYAQARRLQARCEASAPDHPMVPRLRMLIAQSARRAGFEDAIEQYRAELAERELAFGVDAQSTNRARLNLAVALRDSGPDDALTEARALIDRELKDRTVRYGPDNPFTLVALMAKAALLLDVAERWNTTTDAEQALDIASRAAAQREELYGSTHHLTIKARQAVGRALIALRRFDDAVWWLFNLHADEDTSAVHDPGVTAELLANALAGTGSGDDRVQARALAEQAVHAYQNKYGLSGRPTQRASQLLVALS